MGAYFTVIGIFVNVDDSYHTLTKLESTITQMSSQVYKVEERLQEIEASMPAREEQETQHWSPRD